MSGKIQAPAQVTTEEAVELALQAADRYPDKADEMVALAARIEWVDVRSIVLVMGGENECPSFVVVQPPLALMLKKENAMVESRAVRQVEVTQKVTTQIEVPEWSCPKCKFKTLNKAAADLHDDAKHSYVKRFRSRTRRFYYFDSEEKFRAFHVANRERFQLREMGLVKWRGARWYTLARTFVRYSEIHWDNNRHLIPATELVAAIRADGEDLIKEGQDRLKRANSIAARLSIPETPTPKSEKV